MADAVDPPLTALGRLHRWLWQPAHSFWLTRFVLLRLLGLVYAVAFLALANQVLPLIGSDGLTPVAPQLAAVSDQVGAWHGFWHIPTLFWMGAPDRALVLLAWGGFALSLVVLCGYANSIVLAVLWFLYFSFVQIGQDWYGYGWEMQLVETGFLAVFLVPLLDGRPFPRRPPPRLVLLLFLSLVLRIMLGAGLIKLRHDPCWRHLTCLDHHFETQPLPNPLSRTLHFAPHWVHVAGVVFNDIAELLAPLLVFGPRRMRHAAGLVMLAFQVTLILSGNLSFLNWLTIVAIIACFDDGLLARVLPRALARRAEAARVAARPPGAQAVVAAVLFAVYALISIPAAANLLSHDQLMNAPFNRLDLASAYGAFGSVGVERYEIVFEGTDDATLGPDTGWREYQFPCKPGDPMRRPCICAPYQYRLDWQIWFAPPYTYAEFPWTVNLVWKLLHNDPQALRLLDGNPFPRRPPRYVRAVRYRYWFADPDDPTGAWWKRKKIDVWLGPWDLHSPAMREVLAAYGWGPLPAAAASPPDAPANR